MQVLMQPGGVDGEATGRGRAVQRMPAAPPQVHASSDQITRRAWHTPHSSRRGLHCWHGFYAPRIACWFLVISLGLPCLAALAECSRAVIGECTSSGHVQQCETAST